MFQEQIAQLTADHLRTHATAYLDEIAALNPTDQVTLVAPKSIRASSVVGGMVAELPELLPAYGVDALSKQPIPLSDNLWTFQYEGQINGMVLASNEVEVDKLAKRHARAVEYFVRKHRLLHQLATDDFEIISFEFLGSDFSGATPLSEDPASRPLWVGGFSIDVTWMTSENGPEDHA